MKKILTIILCITILAGTVQINTHAGECVNQDTFYVTDTLEISTDSFKNLLNGDGEVIAYYLKGVNDGYAIIGIDGVLMEYSDNAVIEEYAKEAEFYYYDGAYSYYYQKTRYDKPTNRHNITSKKDEMRKIRKEANYNIKFKLKLKSNIATDAKGAVYITYPDGIKDENGNYSYKLTYFTGLKSRYVKNLSGKSRLFCYNFNNNCGSTAAALMIYYYYDNISKTYIKDKTYMGNSYAYQKLLVNHFIELCYDYGNGTTCGQLRNGINKYLKEIGLKQSCRYIEEDSDGTHLQKIMNTIDNDRPCIIGISGKKCPTIGNHWALGLGYVLYKGMRSFENAAFFKINIGWDVPEENAIIYVNFMACDTVVYI